MRTTENHAFLAHMLARIRNELATSRLLKRAFIIAVLLLSLLRVATYFTYLGATAAVDNDFTPDYVSALEWRSGGNAYAPLEGLYAKHLGKDGGIIDYADPEQRNAHPPALILLLSSLTAFPLRTARAILFVAILIATSAGVYLFARRMGLARRAAAVLSCAALALPVVQSDVQYAQINGFMLLCLAWAWRDLQDGRERRAGAVLGVLSAAKLFPWLLIVPIVRARRRQAAVWFVLVAIGLSISAVLIIGLTPTGDYLGGGTLRNVRQWSHGSVLSLVTAPHEWFSPGGIADLSGSAVIRANILGAVLFVACLAAAVATPAGVSGDRYWATVPIMILASPLAWPHYLVMAIPLGLLFVHRFRFKPTLRTASSIVALWLLLAALPFLVWLGVVIGPANRDLTLALLVFVVIADLLQRHDGDRRTEKAL